MGWWIDEARTGAARQFGARHHRGFMTLEVAAVATRILARLLPLIVMLGAGIWLVRHLASAAGAVSWAVTVAVMAVLAVAALIAAAHRLQLMAPLAGLTAATGLAWYVTATYSWWWLIATAGALLLLVCLLVLVRSRVGYGWRVLQRW